MTTTATPTAAPLAQPLELLNIPNAFLKCPTVVAVTGLPERTLYDQVTKGRFPKPVKLSHRCVRWRSQDVLAWLAAQGGAV